MLTEFAPAKVNLYLHVIGRRADGYHLLDSLVVFPGVGDTLTFQAADSLSLAVEGPHATLLAAEADNLVLRAARKLAAVAGIEPCAAITLTKRLPVAAGIGGGSADAAAALRGLARLWKINPIPQNLDRIGLSLGADLPVCLRGRPTQMSGIGEILRDAGPVPPAWLVLVNPRVGLSTPAVFKHRTATYSDPAPFLSAPADAATLAEALALRRNDLAPPAIALMPLVGQMLAAIGATDQCLLSRMSGSGATCFGLFAAEEHAQAAAMALTAAHPDWWVAPAPLQGALSGNEQ